MHQHPGTGAPTQAPNTGRHTGQTPGNTARAVDELEQRPGTGTRPPALHWCRRAWRQMHECAEATP